MTPKQKLQHIIEEIEDVIKNLPEEQEKKYIPTQKQIEKWKNIPPTEKTRYKLQKMGLPKEQLAEIKTQYDAHVFFNNLEDKQ